MPALPNQLPSASSSSLACPPLKAEIKSSLQGLETPAVVIEQSKLQANIDLGAEIASAGGVLIRPHVKTHKSISIARLQLAAGATGVTSAKSEEAEVFLRNGIQSLTLAHPLVDSVKIVRLIQVAAEQDADVRFIADSLVGIEVIGAAAADFGRVAPVFVKVDVGLGRCGVDPAGPQAEVLAKAIVRSENLQFCGLLSHAGHAYAATGPDGVHAIASRERETMKELADRLRSIGIEVPEISVGSTPTLLAHDGFEGLTEVQPGNYVFLDLTQVALGLTSLSQIALSVIATVVSCNSDYAIIDAGSKVLSSDRGPHGSDNLKGYGLAFPLDDSLEQGMTVARLSEEHGFVYHKGHVLRIGSRLRIFPNHSCVVTNLAASLWIVDENGKLEEWPVDARACVH